MESEVWLDHPIDAPGVPAMPAAAEENPVWEGHAVLPTTASAPPQPAQGYDLYRKSTDAADRELTFGLSDKMKAAMLATGHKLGLPSPYDVAGKDDTWSEAYHKDLGAIRGEGEQFAQTNPLASGVARGAGMVGSVAALPSTGVTNAATLIPKMVEGAKLGATAGGLSGFGHSNDQSVTGDLAATGAGAGVGAAIGAGGAAVADKVVSPVVNWIGRRVSPEAAESQAVQAIAKRMKQDANAGGPTAQDMLDALNAAQSKPLSLADVSGENVRQYAGNIARQPGEGRAFAREQLANRDLGAGQRIAGDIDQNLSAGGPAYSAEKALLDARSAASSAPYDKAMQGGSIAPLQDQLRDSLISATGEKGQVARQMAMIEQSSPGALAARGAAGADVRAQYMDLHGRLQQLEQNRQDIRALFQKSQSDAAANAPGAVWNPRIQQFLDDPIMQQGLQRGMTIQRLESLAQGKPFNPTEYAITGTDAAGKPIVGTVPNMRTLDMGKRGLDEIVAESRDPLSGRLSAYGRAVDQARRSYVSELDRVNPDYATARAAWSGPSASLDALRSGQTFLNKAPDEIADEMANIAPGDQEFYRLGAANTLKKAVARTGMGGDEFEKACRQPICARPASPAVRHPGQVRELHQRGRSRE